jgi:hypothetical protein
MKQMYENYHGQYVYFSMFPDLVLETRYTRHLNYQNIGILYGEDASGGLTLLFGVTVIRKSIRLAYLYVLEKLFGFLGQYPKTIITDYDEALAQAVQRLRVRCKVGGALREHLQMPSSFITSNFQQKASAQFLSILSSELEVTLRDSDANSHAYKTGRLLEACEFNPIQIQHKITGQV